MESRRYSALVLVLFLSLFPALTGHAEIIIDLTHPFNARTIYWPTAGGFELKKVFWGLTKKGYYQASNLFSAPEHGGTHMDAPVHFSKTGHTIDQIPVNQLVGKAYVIDLRKKVGDNPDYLISKADIEGAEKKQGILGPSSIVFFNTGWARFWENKKKYLGTDKFGDTRNLHFPGISKEAARYLVFKKVKGVGLDTPSLDYGPATEFWAHRIILGANIYGLENVANLDKITSGMKIIVAPMLIEEGTGAPVRILAITE